MPLVEHPGLARGSASGGISIRQRPPGLRHLPVEKVRGADVLQSRQHDASQVRDVSLQLGEDPGDLVALQAELRAAESARHEGIVRQARVLDDLALGALDERSDDLEPAVDRLKAGADRDLAGRV